MFLGHNFVFERFMQYFSLLIVLCCIASLLHGRHAPSITRADRRCALALATQTAVFYRVHHGQLETTQICCDSENFMEK